MSAIGVLGKCFLNQLTFVNCWFDMSGKWENLCLSKTKLYKSLWLTPQEKNNANYW